MLDTDPQDETRTQEPQETPAPEDAPEVTPDGDAAPATPAAAPEPMPGARRTVAVVVAEVLGMLGLAWSTAALLSDHGARITLGGVFTAVLIVAAGIVVAGLGGRILRGVAERPAPLIVAILLGLAIIALPVVVLPQVLATLAPGAPMLVSVLVVLAAWGVGYAVLTTGAADPLLDEAALRHRRRALRRRTIAIAVVPVLIIVACGAWWVQNWLTEQNPFGG